MKSWAEIEITALALKIPEISLTNSHTGVKEVIAKKDIYRMYVCGITPYDATHLGHAATYLTFDLINRFLRAQGGDVRYVQNITDIDDPLLDRAKRDSIDWHDLAESQIELFRGDMVDLGIIPPAHYIGAVEAIPLVIGTIEKMSASGAIYQVEKDFYFKNHSDSTFGSLSHLDNAGMRSIFAERGGDPDRAGKIDPIDCLVWLAQRPGEPGWESPLGVGRPGWHIECTAIALAYLVPDPSEVDLIDIQGGGSDLIFPHHEMCRAQARVLTKKELARTYVHAGMIGLDGEKMSKSKGNLVFVSQLIAEGVDPMALRYALMSVHYRNDRMWSDEILQRSQQMVQKLRLALACPQVSETQQVAQEIIGALADDLDTPRAFIAIEDWIEKTLAGASGGDSSEFKTVLGTLLGLAL